MVGQPSYIKLHEQGLLEERIRSARKLMKTCRVCPRSCELDRLQDQRGVCRTGAKAMVSSYGAHFGEEDPLVGRKGSGTIFFTNCNLLCVFCQNYDLSHGGSGQEVSVEVLAGLMLELSSQGCHNINFVTPSHVAPQILEALPLAIESGLDIPLVYNSGGYDSVETLRLLEGVFDIYMPDFKFWDNRIGLKYCGVPDYRDRACEALVEMHRQVGDLELDANGVAVKGLLVRHLVMPEGLAGTSEICHFLANEISGETYINIMGQYRPCGEAHEHAELSRPAYISEIKEARDAARVAGLSRLDQRRGVGFHFG